MKVESLNKKWKELLFSLSGFGPNFMMILMGAYFTDAMNPVAMGNSGSYQVIMSGTCFILPAIFPVLYMFAKMFDGFIDIPFAHITDTLSTKWGRRRPMILVCFVPMVISCAMCWIPIGGAENQLLNTIWIIVWSLIFFSTYTMCLIAYYGSFSSTCTSEAQRARISGFKSFFDTISYCVVYALVPVILSAAKIHIDKFVFLCLPLMFTMIIPLFLIKEGKKYGYPELEGLNPEKIKLIESFKITFKNKLFTRFLLVNCMSFFGLQMFLVGMNAMIIGGMNFSGAEMSIINTCAFAPVPIMLYLFNKLKARKGLRFSYQTCLVGFAISILSFFFASTYVTGGNKIIQYVIACVGGVCGSWAIGTFFMLPYLIPAQVASIEEKLTGNDHSAMYFATQAVCTSVVGAIAGSLIYENVKMFFISKSASGIVRAENIEDAAEKFGNVPVDTVFNFGTLIVPFVVCIACLIGFVAAFRMPKNYTNKAIIEELKKTDPNLDTSALECEEAETEEKGEIIFVQVALTILSGFIFGFIWTAFMFKSVKGLVKKKLGVLSYLLACLIPFGSIYVILKMYSELEVLAKEKNIRMTGNKVVFVILSVIFPILPVNIVALSIMQHNVNKILRAYD